ncbi:adenosylcobinamide-phosphate synthase CbiB [Ascidiaceihabitans sp.]|uniref:adenosylcobinamide-phosphate synthase CbiB n=1 Tax=Ascidiaceihabitans sp. TaxID=1872644 RepID=UPI0032977A67
MSTAIALSLALISDAIAGEPKWVWSRLPHPAVLMGRVIGWCDQRFNTQAPSRTTGILVIAALVFVAGCSGVLLSYLGSVVGILIVAILIAQRSLVDHVARVANGLRMSLPEGRRQVAMIVGRDTRDMDGSAVARGAIESGAENLSDGVIAPAFWFLVAGLPGLLIYKIVNTADSMIGYLTPRHAAFGYGAAKLDDLLNLIPARLTALLIAFAGGVLRDWKAISQEAGQHRSPNAGWPEAAMARAINVALSGPRAYEGEMRDFPWVNGQANHTIGATEIDAACAMLWKAWGTALVLCVIIALF